MPRRTLTPQELSAIEDAIVAKAPAGLTDAEFDRYFGRVFANAHAIAEHSPAPLHGSALRRALSGLGETANPVAIAKGLWNMAPIPQALGGSGVIQGPLQAAKSIGQQHLEQGRQALTAAREGNVLEAGARGLASVIPVLGPAAAHTGDYLEEQLAAGERGDVAGGIARGVGLLLPFGVKAGIQAAQVRGVPTPAAMAARRGQRAGQLEAQATQQVADKVLAPGNLAYRGRAQAVAPEVLQRGLRGDRLALRETAQAGMEASGQAIDDAIQAAGGPQALIVTQPVIATLRAQVAKLTYADGMPIKGAEGKVAALRQHIAQLQQQSRGTQPRAGLIRTTGGPAEGAGTPGQPPGTMPFEKVREVRDVNYGRAREARGYERAGNVKMGDEGWAAREVGDAIRQEFAAKSPDLAAANADYAFWKTLDEVLDPAIGRPKATAPPTGVTGGARTSGAAAGMLTGSRVVTFVMSELRPWLQERAARPEWQLADAGRKMQLAEAIRAGRIGTARRLMATWGPFVPRGTTNPIESLTAREPAIAPSR